MPTAEKIFDFLLGKRRATHEAEEQRVSAWFGIPILGLDGLSSAAYGPEAALVVLLPLGLAGPKYIVPVTAAILVVLGLLYLSYRQTILAYPHGGGSYTVAGENLGPKLGLLAAAALLLDYALTVSVGISAGIEAVISAEPRAAHFRLVLCFAALFLIVIANLRGLRESGIAFALPTYLFVGSMVCVLALGLYRAVSSGGHPVPFVNPPHIPGTGEMVGLWLIARAFASGCTAMTGVEAVSNGMAIFKRPAVTNGQRTLTGITGILGVLLLGIALLCRSYGIGATDPGSRTYESVLSQLTGAVVGKGWFYDITMIGILSVLVLSANTGFQGFPRLCRLLAKDGYLPRAFEDLNRTLVYSSGILVLAAISGSLLLVFGGVTDRLIPLFAIGAFLAFTLSQAGMVVHWRRTGGKHSGISLAVNLFGCVGTTISLVVIFAAKFMEGAWITVLIIGSVYLLFVLIKRHYDRVLHLTHCETPPNLNRERPIVVMTISRWSKISEQALELACSISPDIHVLHVSTSEEDEEKLRADWDKFVREPFEHASLRVPQLHIVKSPYREIAKPLIRFVREMHANERDRQLAVVIPEFVEGSWFQKLLHRQYENDVRQALLKEGDQGTVLISVPWRLRR